MSPREHKEPCWISQGKLQSHKRFTKTGEQSHRLRKLGSVMQGRFAHSKSSPTTQTLTQPRHCSQGAGRPQPLPPQQTQAQLLTTTSASPGAGRPCSHCLLQHCSSNQAQLPRRSLQPRHCSQGQGVQPLPPTHCSSTQAQLPRRSQQPRHCSPGAGRPNWSHCLLQHCSSNQAQLPRRSQQPRHCSQGAGRPNCSHCLLQHCSSNQAQLPRRSLQPRQCSPGAGRPNCSHCLLQPALQLIQLPSSGPTTSAGRQKKDWLSALLSRSRAT